MSDNDTYLELFPGWLKNLGADVQVLADALSLSEVPDASKEALAGAINYLFKSLDLIPDGIDDIGYLDDAFVLRVGCELAARHFTGEEGESVGDVLRLASECDPIREYLGDIYARLVKYCEKLASQSARGRSVVDVVQSDEVRADLIADVEGFIRDYQVPGFAREEKSLIKLRAFFDAKLPK